MTSNQSPSPASRPLPSGTVTFLFTDIEGSTQLARTYANQWETVCERHNNILRSAMEDHSGFVFRIVGDSFSAAFHTADDALNAALQAQRNLYNEPWSPAPVKVRMGINTGAAQSKNDTNGITYEGYATLALTQRVMSAGHGGQILLSQTTHDLVKDALRDGIELRDRGEHKLKDILHLERIYQVVAPNLPSEFPALNTLETLRHNLPAQLTSFIGRERELQETRKLILSARLLTLIGPGGTGKTRLSLQLAEEQIENFKDGVWVVELAPIAESANIVPTIASVFELREAPNVPLIEILLNYLRAKQLLLILDNCEHLVEASARIAEKLLQACAGLKIIVSSREALGIEGETIFRVPSLVDDEATRLFVERATKAEPRFKLTESNASFVAQICSRLDGIPLAIELAAARVKLFTPEQIAARLDDRFKLLTGGSRTALPRQQTLRALIDWSYTSLNETEQRALRRLAVFSGGWTFEAAESVVGENEAMESLTSLVNKSLVNVEVQEGESRHRSLETVRQYAMEKLVESGEAVEARDLHLNYFLNFAKSAQDALISEERLRWLNVFELEHDNLRNALQWAVDHHPKAALEMVALLPNFWYPRGYLAEGRRWCRAAIDAAEKLQIERGEDAPVWARALYVFAFLSINHGDHRAGQAAARDVVEFARQKDDTLRLARSLIVFGLASGFLGEIDRAFDSFRESEAISRKMGYKDELAWVLVSLSYITLEVRGKDALAEIESSLEESLSLMRDPANQYVFRSNEMLARLAFLRGDFAEARRLSEKVEAHYLAMGDHISLNGYRSGAAHALRQMGNLDEALAIYRETIAVWQKLGHRGAVAHQLECFAFIAKAQEQPERAIRLMSAAEALREACNSPMTPSERAEYDKEVADLKTNLNDREFNSLWREGRGMAMDEAIELAVK